MTRMQVAADSEAASRAWHEVENMRSHLLDEATAIASAAKAAERRAIEAEEEREDMLVRVQEAEKEKVNGG